jgi:predicted acyltransferase
MSAPAILSPSLQSATQDGRAALPGPRRRTLEPRLGSVDAYRGLVILLMLAEVIRSCLVASALPESGRWRLICTQQTHAAWVGCSLHDLIQPGFYFLVGVGLVLSLTRRLSAGQRVRSLTRHALTRALLLIVLGMALNSLHPRQWTWEFSDTLTQIGLAYPFAFALALRPKRDRYLALAVILIGYWAWFASSALPGPAFDYASVGVPSDWLNSHGLGGFAVHWQKNANVAAQFDRWFLNLFPVNVPYSGQWNGLTSLNFIPSIGTMILGMLAVDVLRVDRSARAKVLELSLTGLLLVTVGWLAGVMGLCPVVKAIWTPSWVLFSGGFCWLLLAGFYLVVDVGGWTRAVFPLRVIGMNSILAYAMFHIHSAIAFNVLRHVLGDSVFEILGQVYAPVLYGSAVLASYWLALYILYRRRIFVRI